MKKGLAWLLCLCLLLPVAAGMALAEGGTRDPMDNFVLAQIFERTTPNPFTSGESWGMQTYERRLGYDFTDLGTGETAKQKVDSALGKLALQFRFFYDDFQNPGRADLWDQLTDPNGVSKPNEGPLNWVRMYTQTDAAGNGVGANFNWTWRTDVRRTDGQVPKVGEWNDIVLPLDGKINTAGMTELTIDYFWVLFSRLGGEQGGTIYRLADVCLVDLTRPAETPVTPVYDTTPLVGEIPYSWNVTVTGNGAATTTAGYGVKLDPPIDASAHDIRQLRVEMDIDVQNKTNPGNVGVLTQIKGQVELTSSGGPDQQERAFGVGGLDWRSGQNHYVVNVLGGSISGGDVQLDNINYFRIYMNGWPEEFRDVLEIKVSNVRITDVTNAPKQLPTFFGDGMMFQRDKDMRLWGFAEAGDAVKAELCKGEQVLETKTGTTPAGGKWELAFAPRAGSYDEYTVKVYLKDALLQTINRVTVGELWLACGQSNMAFGVNGTVDGKALMDAAADPWLRFYLEPTHPQGANTSLLDPATDVPDARWGYGDVGAHVGSVSGVAYTFARDLRAELDMPVGILNTSIGGSIIEAWLPRDGVEADPDAKAGLMSLGKYYDEYFWAPAGAMSTWYNQKIGPLAGMNIAGTIWYQGESDSSVTGLSNIYDKQLNCLKRSWSEKFGFADNAMPFIFTQVAPHTYSPTYTLGHLAEMMERGWALNEADNAAMVTIYDLPLTHVLGGVSSDPIHPRDKTPVGHRFATAAINMLYGGEGESTAPVLESFSVNAAEKAVYVDLRRVGGGLTLLAGDTLHGFAIAGADGIYMPAQAVIVDANTVKVWSNRVNDPRHVTYAYDNFNQAANLANDAGIPASPFRTNTAAFETYYVAQDWMFADGDVWVHNPANTANGNSGRGFQPSFTTSAGTAYSYSAAMRAEGAAALRVDYPAGGGAVGPVVSYESLNFARVIQNARYLSVKVLNPGAAAVTLRLQITSGGTVYTAEGVGGSDRAVSIPAGDRYINVTFDLTKLAATGGDIADPAAKLGALTALTLVIGGEQAGTVFFDAFSYGMTDAVTPETTLNAAEPAVGVTKAQLLALLAMDESDYTADSLNADAYKDAKAAALAVTEKAAPTLSELAAVYDALAAAQAALVLKADDVDKSRFPVVLPPARELAADTRYTKASRDALAAAIARCEAAAGSALATQAEVDGALAALELAAATPKDKDLAAPGLWLYGDVDRDGGIDSTDARLILQAEVSLLTLTEEQQLAADVSGDAPTQVDSTDARMVLQYEVKLLGEFPVQAAG